MGYRPQEYDHLVVGAGAMGTSIAYNLSHDSGRTLVLDRFYENHPFGSSHGRTRILRTAYAEGSAFVPLVLLARRLWKRLGQSVGREIFRPTGVLLAGPEGTPALDRAATSATSYGLPHERLEYDRACRRYPFFRFDPGDSALWDPGGGVLFPERAIHAFHERARDRGVVFRWNSPVHRWSSRGDGPIRVSTSKRDYLAGSVVFSAGAWLPTLVPELRLPLTVEQQSVFWFRARDRRRPVYRDMPAFVWYRSGDDYFYGTPDVGEGVKIGGSQGQLLRRLGRPPASSPRELQSIRRFARERLPGISLKPVRRTRCLYTNTPDKNFIVDRHPDFPNVLIVSACSGHGFKFASAIGELVAQAVTRGAIPSLLAPFRLSPDRGDP